MTTRIFKMDDRPVTKKNWGDYGHILQHGMCSHVSGYDGPLQIERTAPYVPPITLPEIGDVVLTSPARTLLESSGLTGFSFRPVKKAHTVELHWETWDWSAEEPEEFPESGEPEDYILSQPDSPKASAALGDLWVSGCPTDCEHFSSEKNCELLQGIATRFEHLEWGGPV